MRCRVQVAHPHDVFGNRLHVAVQQAEKPHAGQQHQRAFGRLDHGDELHSGDDGSTFFHAKRGGAPERWTAGAIQGGRTVPLCELP